MSNNRVNKDDVRIWCECTNDLFGIIEALETVSFGFGLFKNKNKFPKNTSVLVVAPFIIRGQGKKKEEYFDSDTSKERKHTSKNE